MPRASVGRSMRVVVATAAAAAAGVLGLWSSPASAQQQGGDAQARASCRALGGSWNPTIEGGVEGHRCRINIAYGCGIELAVDANGNSLGGNAWCLDMYVSWGPIR